MPRSPGLELQKLQNQIMLELEMKTVALVVEGEVM